ncbi:ABC transporter G family member 31-like [Silene latifolia]|uniref:ABC transporter G family member 31-like n=1 Tax=Silene latifolia TaxID=37657 RepID=UPI003D771FFC
MIGLHVFLHIHLLFTRASFGLHLLNLVLYIVTQGINGVPPMPDGYNPATWMLEITTPAIEERISADFADIFRNSNQYRDVEASVKQMSTPPLGSEPIRFDTAFSQDSISQFQLCLKKQLLVYWRSPQYNAVRFFISSLCGLIIGSMFWDIGSKRDSSIHIVTIMGALFSSCIFLGSSNASSVQPVVSIERTVFYREKAAGMYAPFPYAAAQALVEIPYLAAQTLICIIITYFMIGFERSLRKFVLYIVFMFLTLTYFTFYGMMAIGVTPNPHMAAIVTSAFYSLWNLQSGFLLPKRLIPKWWIWFNYIDPVAWTLQGLITSQLGDVESMIIEDKFRGTVKEFLKVYYDFGPGMIGISAAVLIGFCLLFCVAFMASIRYFNFQKR